MNAVATNNDAPQFKTPENHVDARTFELRFQYLPAPGSNVSLQLSRTAQTVTRYGNSNVGVASAPSYCAVMRVMVDDAGRSGVGSDTCNIPNRASVNFLAVRQRDLLGAAMPAGDDDSPAGKLLGGFMNTIADSTDTSIAAMQDALAAQQIRVELPLDDGNTALIAVHPQESSFRQFTKACLAAFPTPPKQEPVIPPGGPFGIRTERAVVQTRTRAMRGLRITYVYDNTPAQWTRWQIGDIITEVNGQSVTIDDDIPRAIATSNSNRAGVTLYREGNMLGFDLIPNRIPKGAVTRVSDVVNRSSAGTPAGLSAALKGVAVPLSGQVHLDILPGQPNATVKTGAELLTALDNSLWIPDGAPSDKQVYIIAGPCCGYSQALYRQTRNLQGIQLRWVEMAPTPNCAGFLGGVALSKTSKALVDMYETGRMERSVPLPLTESAVRLNSGVESAIYYLVAALDSTHGEHFDYPILVWLSKDGVRAQMRPDNVDAIFASIASRPEAVNTISIAPTFLNMSFQEKLIPVKMYRAKNDGVPLYSFPDTKSQLVYTLPKDGGYFGGRSVKANGESWIEVTPGLGKQTLFAKESDVHPTAR